MRRRRRSRPARLRKHGAAHRHAGSPARMGDTDPGLNLVRSPRRRKHWLYLYRPPPPGRYSLGPGPAPGPFFWAVANAPRWRECPRPVRRSFRTFTLMRLRIMQSCATSNCIEVRCSRFPPVSSSSSWTIQPHPDRKVGVFLRAGLARRRRRLDPARLSGSCGSACLRGCDAGQARACPASLPARDHLGVGAPPESAATRERSSP
jgi:hypothetical protein